MKVLLVNGSPHQEGATYTALCEVARELQLAGVETEIFWLGNNPIAGCLGCGACAQTGYCFRNDVVNELKDKAQGADGLVFGSAVHYAACTGALSSAMDRLFILNAPNFRLKPAAAVVSCRRGGASAAFDEINKYFTIAQMIVVGSSYWNQIHGANAEQALQDLEGLQTMRNIGRNMAYILKCQQVAEAAGVEKPEREAPVRTNFIR